jgi:hypothetical protein
MKLLLSVVLVMVACGPQKPPPSGYYPRPYHAQPPPPEYPDPFGGLAYGGYAATDPTSQPPYPGSPTAAPYEPSTPPPQPYAQPYAPPTQTMGAPVPGRYSAPPRLADPTAHYSFNGRTATPADLEIVASIERLYGAPAPAGDYWYDSASGAAGRWGGPALGFLPAGMPLGARLPANASGGGNGRLTGVWLNGRELHPVDVQVITRIYGRAIPGHWWLDAKGNAGPDGGPSVMNLFVLAHQRGKEAQSYYRSDGRGNSAFVGGGCVSVSSTSGSGSDTKTTDYSSSGC